MAAGPSAQGLLSRKTELPIRNPTEECLPFHRCEDEHRPLLVLRVTHCYLILDERDLDAAIRLAANTLLPVGSRKVHKIPPHTTDRRGRRSCVGTELANLGAAEWTAAQEGPGRQVIAHLRQAGRAGRPERGRAWPKRPRGRWMLRPRRPRRSPGGRSHGSACRRRTLPATLPGVEYVPTGTVGAPPWRLVEQSWPAPYWLPSSSARSMRSLIESSGFNAAARIWSNNDRYSVMALESSKKCSRPVCSK